MAQVFNLCEASGCMTSMADNSFHNSDPDAPKPLILPLKTVRPRAGIPVLLFLAVFPLVFEASQTLAYRSVKAPVSVTLP